MEVMVGPGLGIGVSAAFVRDPSGSAATREEAGPVGLGGEVEVPAEESSDSSSSIGAPGDSSDEEEENSGDDAVSSKLAEDSTNGLRSLTSLEDSLPVKRGLSNHYKGKSKSFANLSEVTTVKEMEKVEHPLNKKRRVLISNKWRRSSFYSWQSPKSMPLLALDEAEEEGQQRKMSGNKCHNPRSSSSDDEEEVEEGRSRAGLGKAEKSLSLKSQSCFALADLHEEEEDG